MEPTPIATGAGGLSDLLRFLEAGRFDLVLILGLVLVLLWVTKQWREAERDKDAYQAARLEDVKLMVQLSVEVKNTLATVVELIKSSNGRDR